MEREKIINKIFEKNLHYPRINNYPELPEVLTRVNQKRQQIKETLINGGFNAEIFYVPKGHELRSQTLFYELSFGDEAELAGTGLWESHFQSVFEHPDFENVIHFIFPEIIGEEPWDFHHPNILKEFCNRIFGFQIPSYTEVIPIRLATYFYPNVFLPIFKFNELKENCKAFGFERNPITKGDKLFIYNSFLNNQMETLPFISIIKQDISYQVRFTIELLTRLRNNETYALILANTNRVWKKNFFVQGFCTLTELGLI